MEDSRALTDGRWGIMMERANDVDYSCKRVGEI
jgi:hypothetical protein